MSDGPYGRDLSGLVLDEATTDEVVCLLGDCLLTSGGRSEAHIKRSLLVGKPRCLILKRGYRFACIDQIL